MLVSLKSVLGIAEAENIAIGAFIMSAATRKPQNEAIRFTGRTKNRGIVIIKIHYRSLLIDKNILSQFPILGKPYFIVRLTALFNAGLYGSATISIVPLKKLQTGRAFSGFQHRFIGNGT